MESSTPMVFTDFSLPISLPAASAIGSLRSTTMVRRHSFWACSTYLLSVRRYTAFLTTIAQLSSPEKPVRYVTFAGLVRIRASMWFLSNWVRMVLTRCCVLSMFVAGQNLGAIVVCQPDLLHTRKPRENKGFSRVHLVQCFPLPIL